MVEYNREYLDPDLSSITGLILVYMAALAAENNVTLDLKKICRRFATIDYLYAYGFLVALRTAGLVDFDSDFKAFWHFEYVHPALTKDLNRKLRRRIRSELKANGGVVPKTETGV